MTAEAPLCPGRAVAARGSGSKAATITQLDISTAWNTLTKTQQRREWDRFTEALDTGDAGYHRFYRVLMPLWEGGERP